MKEYLKQIINANYSDPLIRERLYEIITSLIQYYGEKYISIIVDALRYTEILICPVDMEMDKFISNKLNMQIDNYYNEYLNKDLINKNNGFACTLYATIEHDSNNEALRLKGNDRKIIFLKNSFDYQKREYIEDISRILIHEIIIQIKSVRNGHIIRCNKKINRCGLQQSYSRIKINDDDNIYTEFLSESGCGANRAITEYDTLMVYENTFGHYFEPTNKLGIYLIKKIFQETGLIKLFHECEITGNIHKLRDCFDTLYYETSFDRLTSLLDRIHEFNYFKSEEEYNYIKNEINAYLDSLNIETSLKNEK